MSEEKRVWLIYQIETNKEKIQKIWYKIKKDDLAKIEYFWIDRNEKLFDDKLRKLDLIINKIVASLEEVEDILNQTNKKEEI